MVWDAEQGDRGRCLGRSAGIASQPLLPGQAGMGALRTREDGRLPRLLFPGSRPKLHIQTRASQPTQARSAMLPPTPITPENRGHAHVEGIRASRSPGADAWWSLRATDTALATGRYDRSRGELHRRSASWSSSANVTSPHQEGVEG